MKKFILFALCACLTVGAGAAKKPAKKAKKGKAPVEVVDTVSIDTFSYHFGRANSNGLKNYLAQRMGIDTTYVEDFMKGFEQAQLTEADKRQKARLAGIEIRQQFEEQVYPSASQQVNDSTDILNKGLFIQGFRDGFVGTSSFTTVSMDSTQHLVQKQMAYYHKAAMEKKYGENRIAGEEYLKANAKKDSVKVTESGLQYKILVKGDGEIPTREDKVKVNYEGHLIDGTEFDSSYKRGKPVTFPVGQVIAGWTEALCMMPVGSKWEIVVPQEIAYGDREQGKIKPFSCLIFTVELLEIEK